VGTAFRILERGLEAAANPAVTAVKFAEAAEGVGEIIWAGLNPAPETPLNVPIGPHRRYTVVRQELDEYREIKNTLGGTVNDVVLTVVAGALARWLRARGVRTQGLQMRALVPVSVRTSSDRGTLGNRLAAMRGPLPVYISDPVARLRAVTRAMDGLKESKQALGAAAMARVNNLAPPTVLAQASRIQFSTRLFNLLVTNIPGPQFPLYVLGRQLCDLFPVAFLPANHALAVAIMSYNGGIDYGLLADYDALPDLDTIAAGINESLAELLAAARGKPVARGRRRTGAGASGRVPASIVPAQASRPKRGPAADMRAKRSPRKRLPGGNGRPPANGGEPEGAE
jgi:WS/DGAT/MGAT family acyltransferase